MSAAMVKLGVYGLLLVTLRLLPDGPRWWAIGLLVLGGVSAVYGILEASVTSDLKRLLAFSTTENVGLMVAGLAVAMMLRNVGQQAVADVALVAVVLLVISHAAFKAVLFLGAGSILHTTGERDLDRLGLVNIGARARSRLQALARGIQPWCRWSSVPLSAVLGLGPAAHRNTPRHTSDQGLLIALKRRIGIFDLRLGLPH